MAFDESYRISEPRTVIPGSRSVWTIQSWNKESQAAKSGESTSPSSAATHATTSLRTARSQIETSLTQIATYPLAEETSPRQAYSFEQALTESKVTSAAPVPPSRSKDSEPATEKEWSMDDVFDVINPLQHIPIVSMAYRSLTGDTIGAIGNILGGALYGGPIGAIVGTVDSIIHETTGKDIAENVLGFVTDGFSHVNE